MSTPDEFIKLFEVHPTLPRAVCVALKVALAHGEAFKEGVAAVFPLFDPETKEPSGQSLFVALSQQQAMTLARLIQDHAKEQGWPDLGDVTRSRTPVPPSDEIS